MTFFVVGENGVPIEVDMRGWFAGILEKAMLDCGGAGG
jgi:hypothetical protein